ncbi:ABC transporter ATP-binding protein [Bacillus ginsengihumi]|uniref:ABC transporter n=1 Tax=Heyndrickxia ginsengihumi TaxID=363870 RepID=A0A0A6VEW5_9BACI|nr:ABC transporter ATP-binding protein [Heyndrickxia ginsengihumi]KHD85099.1 ABC transporter [Heyndrickxia ginsengihumi]MBE6184478.1 ABC transporter ATP-binding protein [Bacillus sp. (in: firmicutes)]MCM3022727.1 ABC transporter ATP-binding protein [Heyndrickxia ginsengihumi]NEY18934.1 ABC transporter ATP-binding protein [Heyndrickxia ginsengihumi]
MELTAEKIEVKRGKKEIIKNISVFVKDKQFVGLIGPNGCGKSTLLKSIYKSLIPQSGSVFLDDLDVLKSSEKKVSQRLGVVGQFNEMNFDLTVEQMVLLGRTPHKKLLEPDKQDDYQIVEEALRRTQLLEYRRRSYLSLSGGEKQRVILARTIAQEPQLMVLDEPTNHLDIRHQFEILSCVKQLGISVLAALHDLELAVAYCDYVYAIKDGEVYAHGKPEEVLTSELIEDLYQIRCQTYVNPVTHRLGFAYEL